MILMIDNYDSFTYNVVQYLGELGAEVNVVRNDEITLDAIEALAPAKIVISPGPCTPNEAGISLEVIRRFAGRIPALGVCLGHQCIGQAFGGRIVRARAGHARQDLADPPRGTGVFRGLREPVPGHALPLAGDRAGDAARLPRGHGLDRRTSTARVDEIMGVRHRELAVEGVQFHPESILTQLRARAAGELPRRGLSRLRAGALNHGHQAGTGSRRQSHRPQPRGDARRHARRS